VGEELYRMFIYGYTRKQWQRHPRELPASIIKRLSIRTELNDNYFDDTFQGIPENGYTPIFERLLEGVEIECGVDFFERREQLSRLARKTVFTGKIDQFFDHQLGELEYRTIRFDTQRLEIADYQGNAVVNYTDESVPFTRVVEHKHFYQMRQAHTFVTWEYPEEWRRGAEPYYPINDSRNQRLFDKYRTLAQANPGVIIGGRLGSYRYYDMHQVIGAALAAVRGELAKVGQVVRTIVQPSEPTAPIAPIHLKVQ